MTDTATLQEQQLENSFDALVKELGSYPLGAVRKRKRVRQEGEAIKKSHKRPYVISCAMTMSRLRRLERLVYRHASNFSEFMDKLACGMLLVARKKDVLWAFKEELIEDGFDRQGIDLAMREGERPPCEDGDDGICTAKPAKISGNVDIRTPWR